MIQMAKIQIFMHKSSIFMHKSFVQNVENKKSKKQNLFFKNSKYNANFTFMHDIQSKVLILTLFALPYFTYKS